ncbi:hypothetical protein C8J57DRAFT_1478794 [Mycena rebaudengoi]|nr:hypothetical protein C8J57DRAFT_1478794 [Mycena rebaudengoi]
MTVLRTTSHYEHIFQSFFKGLSLLEAGFLFGAYAGAFTVTAPLACHAFEEWILKSYGFLAGRLITACLRLLYPVGTSKSSSHTMEKVAKENEQLKNVKGASASSHTMEKVAKENEHLKNTKGASTSTKLKAKTPLITFYSYRFPQALRYDMTPYSQLLVGSSSPSSRSPGPQSRTYNNAQRPHMTPTTPTRERNSARDTSSPEP